MDDSKVDGPGRFARECRDAMPGQSGSVFAELWQQIVMLVAVWKIFTSLYASGEEPVEVLNKTSGFLFQYFSQSLARDLYLRIARLTDPSHSGGGRKQHNISLPRLVHELNSANQPKILSQLKPKVDSLVNRAESIRQTRHKTIAHTDLPVALKQVTPPTGMPLKEIGAFIDDLAEAMNIVELHYRNSKTSYGLGSAPGGVQALLTCLRAGHRVIESERL